MSETCRSCSFWKQEVQTKSGESRRDGVRVGNCLRFPPVLDHTYIPPDDEGCEANELFWVQPVTEEGAWCGEFIQANPNT